MSDLHCAATLLLVRARDADEVLGAVPGRHVARLYSVPATHPLATVVADLLGVDAVAGAGLDELSGTPSAAEAVDAGRGALMAIADAHRGETVVALLPPSTGADQVVELSVDADGVVVTGQKSRVDVSSIPRSAS